MSGGVKVYLAGERIEKPVKWWNGSAWAIKPLKRWDGSAWVLTHPASGPAIVDAFPGSTAYPGVSRYPGFTPFPDDTLYPEFYPNVSPPVLTYPTDTTYPDLVYPSG